MSTFDKRMHSKNIHWLVFGLWRLSTNLSNTPRNHVPSSSGVEVVTLLACGVRGPWFESGSRQFDIRDLLLPSRDMNELLLIGVTTPPPTPQKKTNKQTNQNPNGRLLLLVFFFFNLAAFGWWVFFKVVVTILRSHLDLEARDQVSEILVARSGFESRTLCSARQEVDHYTIDYPIVQCQRWPTSHLANAYYLGIGI